MPMDYDTLYDNLIKEIKCLIIQSHVSTFCYPTLNPLQVH